MKKIVNYRVNLFTTQVKKILEEMKIDYTETRHDFLGSPCFQINTEQGLISILFSHSIQQDRRVLRGHAGPNKIIKHFYFIDVPAKGEKGRTLRKQFSEVGVIGFPPVRAMCTKIKLLKENLLEDPLCKKYHFLKMCEE